MPGIAFSGIDGFEPAPTWRFFADFPLPSQISGSAGNPLGDASTTDVGTPGFGDGGRPLDIVQRPNISTPWQRSLIGLLAHSFQLIHKNIETDQVVFNAGPRYFPQIVTYDMLNVTFIETHDYEVARFYTSWRKKIVDADGNFGLPKDYWQRIVIEPINLRGQKTIKYEYEDCFPVRCDGVQMDGSSTNHGTCTISFVVNTVVDPK